jgi:anti-anti-sigma factor
MFQRERQGAVDVIRGADALIGERLDQFGELLGECLDGGQPRAVLDLQQVPLIDSAGLERLLEAREQFEQLGGSVKLLAPNALCEDILMATGVGEKFEVFLDLKQAVGSFAL